MSHITQKIQSFLKTGPAKEFPSSKEASSLRVVAQSQAGILTPISSARSARVRKVMDTLTRGQKAVRADIGSLQETGKITPKEAFILNEMLDKFSPGDVKSFLSGKKYVLSDSEIDKAVGTSAGIPARLLQFFKEKRTEHIGGPAEQYLDKQVGLTEKEKQEYAEVFKGSGLTEEELAQTPGDIRAQLSHMVDDQAQKFKEYEGLLLLKVGPNEKRYLLAKRKDNPHVGFNQLEQESELIRAREIDSHKTIGETPMGDKERRYLTKELGYSLTDKYPFIKGEEPEGLKNARKADAGKAWEGRLSTLRLSKKVQLDCVKEAFLSWADRCPSQSKVSTYLQAVQDMVKLTDASRMSNDTEAERRLNDFADRHKGEFGGLQKAYQKDTGKLWLSAAQTKEIDQEWASNAKKAELDSNGSKFRAYNRIPPSAFMGTLLKNGTYIDKTEVQRLSMLEGGVYFKSSQDEPVYGVLQDSALKEWLEANVPQSGERQFGIGPDKSNLEKYAIDGGSLHGSDADRGKIAIMHFYSPQK